VKVVVKVKVRVKVKVKVEVKVKVAAVPYMTSHDSPLGSNIFVGGKYYDEQNSSTNIYLGLKQKKPKTTRKNQKQREK